MSVLAGKDLREANHPTVPVASAGGPEEWRNLGGPELELLLLCLRWPLRESDREQIVALSAANLDWSRFLRLAIHHRVVPLIAHTLNVCLRRDSLPVAVDVLAELRRIAAANAQESLRKLGELRRLSQSLEANGIALRVLKGLPLSQSVFGDLSLRAAGDIDLLVAEEAVAAFDGVLRSLGYGANLDIRGYSPRRLAFYSAHWKDIIYHDGNTGSQVDLHWRCFRNRAMPGTNLGTTSQTETVAFGGMRVAILPRIESLLYLCVHGTLDGWLYLKQLVDVAAQVRSMREAELDALADAALGYGILPELTATLLLVRRYLAMDHWSSRLLPADDPTVRHIIRYSDRVLVAGGFLAERESIPIAATLAFELGLSHSFRYRLELLIRVLFRVRMWNTIPLPDFLFGLYPLLSPFEWLIFHMRPGPE